MGEGFSDAPSLRESLAPRLDVPPFAAGGVGAMLCDAARAYLDEYVLSTEGPDYEPTEFERELLQDFWNGLVSDERFFGPIRQLLALASTDNRKDGSSPQNTEAQS